MKQIDWTLLRMPVIVLTIALVFSFSILSVSSYYNDGQLSVSTKLDNDLQRAKRRYNEARRDRSLYKQYLESYLQYADKGFIGAEQRLDWIEQLQEKNKTLKLSSLKYEISPQKQVGLNGLRMPKNISVYTSKMDLMAGLLHEGDGLSLLKALRDDAKGFFSIGACEFDSKVMGKAAQLEYRPNATYVTMDCDLNWYTISVGS